VLEMRILVLACRCISGRKVHTHLTQSLVVLSSSLLDEWAQQSVDVAALLLAMVTDSRGHPVEVYVAVVARLGLHQALMLLLVQARRARVFYLHHHKVPLLHRPPHSLLLPPPPCRLVLLLELVEAGVDVGVRLLVVLLAEVVVVPPHVLLPLLLAPLPQLRLPCLQRSPLGALLREVVL